VGEPAASVHRRDPHLRRRLLRHAAKRVGPGDPAGAAVRRRASPQAVCRRERAVAWGMWEGRRLAACEERLTLHLTPQPRVEQIAQPIAEEIDPEPREQDRETWEDGDPAGYGPGVAPLRQHPPPRRRPPGFTPAAAPARG